MTVTPYGIHDGDVVFVDDNGWARIPVRVMHALSHAAVMADAGYAAWAGRRFDRDDLATLRRDLDAKALPPLDTCSADGCEDAAPFVLAHARPYCETHAKETQ